MADGNIVAAKRELRRAVERLTGPRRLHHYEVTLLGSSLYDELGDNAPSGGGDVRIPPRSTPPLWLDPTALRIDIDRTVRGWCPAAGSTPARLGRLCDRGWRPQDSDVVWRMSSQVRLWCEQITALLWPESRKDVAAACPACGRAVVWRRRDGEVVRESALRLVAATGCECQACGAFWAPEKFLFLSRLLGFELPEGVLE